MGIGKIYAMELIMYLAPASVASACCCDWDAWLCFVSFMSRLCVLSWDIWVLGAHGKAGFLRMQGFKSIVGI